MKWGEANMVLRIISTIAGCLVGFASILFLPTLSGGDEAPPASDRDEVIKRIEELQPTAKERRFDEIGWASGITAAEKLAKASGRPVFLFSNVGELDIGRC
jgi:hypothetical protein